MPERKHCFFPGGVHFVDAIELKKYLDFFTSVLTEELTTGQYLSTCK